MKPVQKVKEDRHPDENDDEYVWIRSLCLLPSRDALKTVAASLASKPILPHPAQLDKGRGTEYTAVTLGAVAHLGERCNRTAEVVGSNPISSTLGIADFRLLILDLPPIRNHKSEI